MGEANPIPGLRELSKTETTRARPYMVRAHAHAKGEIIIAEHTCRNCIWWDEAHPDHYGFCDVPGDISYTYALYACENFEGDDDFILLSDLSQGDLNFGSANSA